MLRTVDGVVSSIHTAGRPGAGLSALPKALVLLVNTTLRAPASAAASSTVSVPVTLVSTKSWRPCEPTCGVWRVQGRGGQDVVGAVESAADGVAVVDRADDAGERRGEHVEADHVVALVPQGGGECLAEVTGSARDAEGRHVRVRARRPGRRRRRAARRRAGCCRA